jgi:6-hydroxytryprostatin B O-methyltransferase
MANLDEQFQYVSCLTWLCQYNIFHLVPLDGSISYADLAASARVPEQRLKSMIRMAITNALFREQPDGDSVKHSATSAFLARDSEVYTYATYMCTRSAPMAMHMAAAHAKWGADTTRTSETAYNAAFDTELPFFDHIAQDEARMKEFAAYMRHVRSSDGLNLSHLAAGFAWQNIRDGGIVVDVSIVPALFPRCA